MILTNCKAAFSRNQHEAAHIKKNKPKNQWFLPKAGIEHLCIYYITYICAEGIKGAANTVEKVIPESGA